MTALMSDLFVPIRDGGLPCGKIEMHAPHGRCPGLRPSHWVKVPCEICEKPVWVPPSFTSPSESKRVAVCSSQCAMKVIAAMDSEHKS